MRILLLFALAFTTTPLIAAEKPNILVVLTDDQGWGDLSVHGNTNLSTPNVDSLARDGALFERFYVCPVCSPTRAEFLTGRYHPRGGVWSTSTGGERLDLDEKTIADTFKVAGYATGCFGKWHNGSQYPYHPNGRGFDEYYDRAIGMLTSDKVRQAFDLSSEPAEVRDRYGRTTYGQGCLLARRLAEAGVKFTTVYFSSSIGGQSTTSGGWDTHGNNFNCLKDHLLPEFFEPELKEVRYT